MPALMKASSNITVHYRNNICTITTVQTMFAYVIETTYLLNTANGGYCCLYPAPDHILPI
jgi:hypothetical protein